MLQDTLILQRNVERLKELSNFSTATDLKRESQLSVLLSLSVVWIIREGICLTQFTNVLVNIT